MPVFYWEKEAKERIADATVTKEDAETLFSKAAEYKQYLENRK